MTDVRVAIKYRGECVNHGTVTTEGYLDVQPTVCPVDGLDPFTNVREFDSIREDKMIITDENPNEPNKYMQLVGIDLDVPGGTAGTEYTLEYVMPAYDTACYGFEALYTEDNLGDSFHMHAAPKTVIGVITTEAAVNDTVLNVNPTVVEHAIISSIVTLKEANSTEHTVGKIVHIDSNNNQITLSTPITTAVPAMSEFRITIVRMENIHIVDTKGYSFGRNKIGAAVVPANTMIHILYTNNSGLPKKFNFLIECSV